MKLLTLHLSLFFMLIAWSIQYAFAVERIGIIGQIQIAGPLPGLATKSNNTAATPKIVNLAVGDAIYQSDVLITPTGTFVTIEMIDQTTITISPKSKLDFEKFSLHTTPTKTSIYNLLVGEIRALFQPLVAPADSITIKTSSVSMAIRGTEVIVGVQDNDTTVAVISGKIAVDINFTADFDENKEITDGQKFAIVAKGGTSTTDYHESIVDVADATIITGIIGGTSGSGSIAAVTPLGTPAGGTTMTDAEGTTYTKPATSVGIFADAAAEVGKTDDQIKESDANEWKLEYDRLKDPAYNATKPAPRSTTTKYNKGWWGSWKKNTSNYYSNSKKKYSSKNRHDYKKHGQKIKNRCGKSGSSYKSSSKFKWKKGYLKK